MYLNNCCRIAPLLTPRPAAAPPALRRGLEGV